jgi:spore germination cell wall hydrolase CwlJ-like protein
MKWICATVVPWALAGGLLVSFTASASNDAGSGVSAATRSAVAYLTQNVVPSIQTPGGHMIGLSSAVVRNIPRYDLIEDSNLVERGNQPRSERKVQAGPAYPQPQRSLKGNPLKDLRPSVSRVAASMKQELQPGSGRLMFSRDENLLPPTVLMQGELEEPALEQVGFEPWTAPELTTTHQATSIQSPAAAAAGSTGAAASSTTPRTSKAVVLSSATPAPTEATPMEIAAAPVSRLGTSTNGTSFANKSGDEPPRYADLIDAGNLGKEQRCLAEVVYFEARSESEAGQAAVAQVVLNRMKSGLYPSSICGVVYQNRHRHLACQFTFACEGKALRITESESWESAKRIASAVLEGRTYLAEVGGSTHYHADYVKPYWARRLKKMDVIGRHVFYKLKPGQT